MGKKVLLYSGGMDSWLISKIWNPDVLLYVDMESRYAEEEIKRLPDNVIIEKLDLSKWEREDSIIPLRNLYLVMLATNYGDEICLGATGGDRVLDKSLPFAHKASDLLSYLYQPQHWTEGRDITVNLDYKDYTKTELVAKFVEQGGNMEEAVKSSFSCYHPEDGKECWKCKPCVRKFVAFYINGYEDFSTEAKTRVLKVLEYEIMPQVYSGTYGRGEVEESDIILTHSALLEECV